MLIPDYTPAPHLAGWFVDYIEQDGPDVLTFTVGPFKTEAEAVHLAADIEEPTRVYQKEGTR